MGTMSELTASYLIGRADRIVRSELEAAIADRDLSLPEFTALSVLMARPGLSNAGLARRSLVTPQAMHKVIRSLEDAGLVTRASTEGGGRAMATTITEAGIALVADLRAPVRAAEQRALSGLTSSERQELVRLLKQATSMGRH